MVKYRKSVRERCTGEVYGKNVWEKMYGRGRRGRQYCAPENCQLNIDYLTPKNTKKYTGQTVNKLTYLQSAAKNKQNIIHHN
jgi:hypothetical protein